jgi:hypothetical protein
MDYLKFDGCDTVEFRFEIQGGKDQLFPVLVESRVVILSLDNQVGEEMTSINQFCASSSLP